MSLEFEQKSPLGKTDQLIVLIHGYGADGHDLIGLADPLQGVLPNALFLSPHAPDPCQVNPMGRQWFPISWLDGSDPVEMEREFTKNALLFDKWLSTQISKAALPSQKVALVGFSQGTMIGLQVAPRRGDPLGAVVGFSGRLLAPDALAADVQTKPPVLLVHGDADDVVPYDSMALAETGLFSAGLNVETHTSKGVGHGIAQDGLETAATFLTRYLL
ncbi:MAG: alpha/beta fold hydrolase [Pseudomonadota bacterium]